MGEKGLDIAFESADEELLSFVEEFKYNTSVFNAFKTHAEHEALTQALIDENGHLRSFRNFKKAVSPIIGKYNNAWLQTEYNTAIRAADAARYYQEALRTKHIFPNLEYLESLAQNKREEHLEWVGTILPIEHPWWDTHMPPSAWNCRCSVKKTRKAATEVPKENEDDEQMPDVLRQNPGKTASPFKLDEHPYTHDRGVASCPECRRQGLADPTGEGNELCPMHHQAMIDIQKREYKAVRKEFLELLRSKTVEMPQFGGRRASFTRNSVMENLGYGALQPVRKEVMRNIDEYLNDYLERYAKKHPNNEAPTPSEMKRDDIGYRYEENNKIEKEGKVSGYYKYVMDYKGSNPIAKGKKIELQFEEKTKGEIVFYFVKIK